MEPTESTDLLYGVRNQIIDAITELAIVPVWSTDAARLNDLLVKALRQSELAIAESYLCGNDDGHVHQVMEEMPQNSDVERFPVEKVFGHDFSEEFAVGPSRAFLEAYAIVEEKFRGE